MSNFLKFALSTMALLSFVAILFIFPGIREKVLIFTGKKKVESIVSGLSTKSDPVPIAFTDRLLMIPEYYLPDAPPRNFISKEVKTLAIVALLPNFDGRTKENWDEFRQVPGFGRRINLLVNSLDGMQPELRQDYLRQVKNVRTGVDKFSKSKVTISSLEDQFGLLREATDYSGAVHHEILYRENDGKIEVAIFCNFDDLRYGGRVPGCKHWYVMDDLNAVVSLGYHKTFLPEWKKIEQKSKSLIRSFFATPAQRQKFDWPKSNVGLVQ